jgi:hypothetical protein
MIGVPVFGILGILCAFGWNYYGLKIKELEKTQSTVKNEKNISQDTLDKRETTTYIVSGDVVHGNKTTKHEDINAPNALIVTKNQSGGQNTVNYYKNEYEPLDTEVEKEIDNKLSLFANNKDYPKIIIEIEANNSQRNKVAKVLERLLTKYNLGFYPEGNTYIGRFPDNPVSVFVNSKNMDFANKLINILQLYIKEGFKIIPDDNFPVDFIKIYINGQPLFDKNGTLKIE